MPGKFCALVLLVGFATAPLSATDDSWVSIGPWGGSVASLVVDPRNPRILYAGSVGGLFKSIDGGASWMDIHGTLPLRTIQALAISPSAPDRLYVAVGYYSEGYGVFHSTDGGASWQRWQRGFESGMIQIYSLAVHPRDPKVVVASAPGAVFKTTDGGVRWTRIATGNLLIDVKTLVFHPSRPTTLYAGSAHGVVKSTNGGSSWTSASTGLGDRPVHAILLAPGKPDTLYAGTPAGVFKSTDAAGHWQPASTGLTGQDVLSLAASPAGGGVPATLWAGTATGAFRSRNGGASWVPASLGLRNQRIAAFAVHPAVPRVLWAASGAAQEHFFTPGLFKSVNGGDRWRISNHGISAQYTTSIAVDPLSPGVLWASLSGGGVWRTADGGATWVERNRGLSSLDVTDVVIHPAAPEVLWAGTLHGLFQSRDGGATWELRSSEVTDPANGQPLWVLDVGLSPQDPRVIWIGTGRGLFRSVDEGETWTPALQDSIVRALLADPQDVDRLLASSTFPGALEGILEQTSDGGVTWTSPEIPLGFPYIFSLARDPADHERLAMGGILSRLGRSNDGGQTWVSLPTPSFSGTIYSLAFDPVDGSIWAGAIGIHHVTEDGSPQMPPLLDATAFDLEFDPHDPAVLYAASGRGILKHMRRD